MKTLIVEDDRIRAQSCVAMFGGADAVCYVAPSPAQARLMLIATRFDRLCLRLSSDDDACNALLALARATNPDCEVVDVAGGIRRTVTGPMSASDKATPPAKRPS